MGRELRKVAATWQHPKDGNGNYVPLSDLSFTQLQKEYEEEKKQWDNGFSPTWDEDNPFRPKKDFEIGKDYEEFFGGPPEPEFYMPEWNEKEKTHIQLYETTSEGTPISPLFPKEQFEQLCEFAAKNCTTFANGKATKEEWMKMLSEGLVYHRQGNIMFI